MTSPVPETDEVLYRRYLQKGCSDDLRVLLERHREGLTLFLNGYVHNLEDAEELMMDAFAVAASGTAKFRGSSSFKTWLYAIGRNQAMHHLRKNRLRLVPIEEEIEAPGEAPDLGILREERNRELYLAMARLTPEYRQVLYLLYFEEMDHEQIADVMGKNRKQVYNLADRGRAALRKELELRGISTEAY